MLMKLIELRKIEKFYFGYEELARTLGISTASARVTASRYVQKGLLVRIKRNLYVLRESWVAATREEKFLVANLGQTPSYLSLMTALDYHNITTQIQRDFFESVATQRTKTLSAGGSVFRYSKISTDLYFGFEKKDGFFIANPEKALLDAVYLSSYGRYALDFSALDPKKISRSEMDRMSRQYPYRTRKLLQAYGYLQTT
ncbi:type IV toxin-antitoxin system AbiEi family antitoxin domain-containing protein [Thermodesulfobacteriota bacterium]